MSLMEVNQPIMGNIMMRRVKPGATCDIIMCLYSYHVISQAVNRVIIKAGAHEGKKCPTTRNFVNEKLNM